MHSKEIIAFKFHYGFPGQMSKDPESNFLPTLLLAELCGQWNRGAHGGGWCEGQWCTHQSPDTWPGPQEQTSPASGAKA